MKGTTISERARTTVGVRLRSESSAVSTIVLDVWRRNETVNPRCRHRLVEE
jgi:hypothetical protein